MQKSPKAPVTLLSLPNELLLIIGQGLVHPRDSRALVLTNHRFSYVFITRLYECATTDKGVVTGVQLAASQGLELSVKLLLGAKRIDLEFHYDTGETGRVQYSTTSCCTVDFSKADIAAIGRRTALNHAVEIGSEELVRLFLGNGASVDKQDGYGETALHRAAKGESKAILELLLERKPDLKLCDKLGNTALHHSASFSFKGQRFRTMKMLLEYGAIVNTSNRRGETALYIASIRGKEKLVKLLIQYGANVTVAERGGLTPLHAAASRGHEKVVEILLNNKADRNACDRNGLTPLGHVGRRRLVGCGAKHANERIIVGLLAGNNPKSEDSSDSEGCISPAYLNGSGARTLSIRSLLPTFLCLKLVDIVFILGLMYFLSA